ncbi:MAG: hypothetical protein KBC48_00365 [Candidatus Pacebacteria bacterium]|nr:hypothetical protein [Candidatus Paceibacterota bacterium]
MPTFYVTVEPAFTVAAQGIVSGGGVTPGAPQQSTLTSPWFNASVTHNPQSLSPSQAPNQMLGYGASAQVVTSLMNMGNVSVIDYATYMANPDKYPDIFIIRGTVTEFSETNQLDESKKGGSTGPAGVLFNTVGNIFDVPGLSIGGQVMSIANAGKKTVITTRTGMVGISLQILEAKSGRIIGAPLCKGTFSTQSATQIKHGLGLESSKAEYLASTLDQAGQAALNDGNTQLWAILKRQVSSQVAALPAEAPEK